MRSHRLRMCVGAVLVVGVAALAGGCATAATATGVGLLELVRAGLWLFLEAMLAGGI